MVAAHDSLLSIKDLSFRYPGTAVPVWSGLSLDLRRGDRLLLAGPSGIGKSTLLGIMTGLVPRLTSGTVSGTIERNFANYGLVMQNPYAQLVTPTVYEEIAFGLENAGLPVAEICERVDAMLERFGIIDLKNRVCGTLSGGEAQKVSLACALICEPEILFLDEPTAYLDPWSAAEFFALLAEFARGRTMVIVEHRVGEAAALVNRVFLLRSNPIDAETSSGDEAPDLKAALSALAFPATPSVRTAMHADAGTQYSKALPLLDAHNLHFQYGDMPILDGLDLVLQPGRIAVVMGASGSGKSTLLKKITGWLSEDKQKRGRKPQHHPQRSLTNAHLAHLRNTDQQRLEFAGRSWLGTKAKHRASDIVHIPQNPEHFFLTMTVKDELAYTCADAEEIKSVAGLFRLPFDSVQHPASLSEGEKRRLTLACVFLDPRPLVLMDEPSYGLDASSIEGLVDGLSALRSQGRCILIVTHSPELAAATADDLYFMKNGSLERKELSELNTLLRPGLVP